MAKRNTWEVRLLADIRYIKGSKDVEVPDYFEERLNKCLEYYDFTDQHKQMLDLFYKKAKTLEECMAEMNLKKSRASTVKAQLLERLRNYLDLNDPETPIEEKRVEQIRILKRTESILFSNGVHYVKDLLKYNEAKLLKLHGMGEATLQDIYKFLADNNLKLKD